jgi:hypothetical protein
MTKRPKPQRQIGVRLFLVGGALAIIAGLATDVQSRIASARANLRPENCTGKINPDATVSREQLANFLTVAERGSKAAVQDILQAPYCELPKLEVRAGVPAERTVYRLAFDPQTWLVVLFEGNEYAGYQLRVLR